MENRNVLFNLDWYDEHFISNFLNEKLDIKEYLNRPRFRLKDELISSRVVNHWQELGLITDNRPEGKGWRKFSISEMVWINIIIKLRKFGIDLNRIKAVKDYLSLFSSDKNQSKYPELDFYILYVLSTSKPVSLIVFDSGEALLGSQIEIDIAKQYGGIKDDFISIDLNKLVNIGLNKLDNKTDYLNYSLSSIQKEINNALLFEDIYSLTLKVKDGGEYLLDKEFIMSSKHEMNMLLNKLQYAESSITKRGAKNIYKIIEKKKIKNK